MIMLLLLVLISCPFTAFAEDKQEDEYKALIDEINSELEGLGGDDAQSYLRDNGITADSKNAWQAYSGGSCLRDDKGTFCNR